MLATTVFLLILLLALSIPIAASLALLAFGLDFLYSSMPLYRAMGEIFWSANTDFLLVAIPLFVMLGEILLRIGAAERVYAATSHWLSWLPGGLMHCNIGACTLFAAVSGSTVATAATVGTAALPQMEKNGYSPRLFLGTLAAGGTLGILIPPSINIIVYGALTDTSIPDLYLAGILPGLILAALFMATVIIICVVRPEMSGTKVHSSWKQRFSALRELVPPMAIFTLVIGSIYLGWATPTESAALGVVAALILAIFYRQLSFAMLRAAIEGTMRTTAMIMLIILASFFLNFVLATIGLTRQLTDFVIALQWSPIWTLIAIIGFYIILGFFLETLTLMITTVPILAPLVFALGYDPVWFGILLMLLIETALITPPVGLNLYVIQGIRKKGPISDVVIGSLPFVVSLFAMVILLMLFPGIALIVPQYLR